MITREEAWQYVGGCVDDALSPRGITAIPTDPEKRAKVVLVGWQCGFEPMFIAVWSYLDVQLEAGAATVIAVDYLQEKGWFADAMQTEPDYVL